MVESKEYVMEGLWAPKIAFEPFMRVVMTMKGRFQDKVQAIMQAVDKEKRRRCLCWLVAEGVVDEMILVIRKKNYVYPAKYNPWANEE